MKATDIDNGTKFSRRALLNLVSMAGGSAAVLRASAALGLMPVTAMAAAPNVATLAPDTKKTVAILGAGVAGLTAMYELTKAGYECVLLEASHRPGGRNMTVRSGDIIDEVGNRQVVEFDDEPHLYFNCGPARIPSTHRNLLRYCKELGVELEVFINESKEAYVQDDAMFGGKPVKNAIFTTSARGFMAEVMAKNFSAQQLELPFSQQEAERLIGAIRSWGDLDKDLKFGESGRLGYKSGGYLDHGVHRDVAEFRELLKSRYINNLLSANEGETGPILFQPVGGMDKIIEGFMKQLGDRVYLNAIVTGIEVTSEGVNLAYQHKGERQTLRADYCLNSIPTHLMAGIPNNFAPDYVDALRYVKRGQAYKSAFQAKERFWEKDDIYGGITWTNQPIQQIWYPSHGFHKPKGVFLSAYDFGGGMGFTQMTHEERLEAAIKQGEKVHPEYRSMVEKGITVAWHRMNHMLGCAAIWSRDGGKEEKLMELLRAPQGDRHYVIGDQVTLHAGWQEAAIASAHAAIEDINRKVNGTAKVASA
jgi:monoamine oxidase